MRNDKTRKPALNIAGVAGMALLGSSLSFQVLGAGSYYNQERDVMVPYTDSSSSEILIKSDQVSSVAPSGEYKLIVRNHRLVSGPDKIKVDHGERVSLVIEAERPDILHVDGYGLNVNIPAGEPVLVSFIAEQPGQFFYRLAHHGRPIGVLDVAHPDVSMSVH